MLELTVDEVRHRARDAKQPWSPHMPGSWIEWPFNLVIVKPSNLDGYIKVKTPHPATYTFAVFLLAVANA